MGLVPLALVRRTRLPASSSTTTGRLALSRRPPARSASSLPQRPSSSSSTSLGGRSYSESRSRPHASSSSPQASAQSFDNPSQALNYESGPLPHDRAGADVFEHPGFLPKTREERVLDEVREWPVVEERPATAARARKPAAADDPFAAVSKRRQELEAKLDAMRHADREAMLEKTRAERERLAQSKPTQLGPARRGTPHHAEPRIKSTATRRELRPKEARAALGSSPAFNFDMASFEMAAPTKAFVDPRVSKLEDKEAADHRHYALDETNVIFEEGQLPRSVQDDQPELSDDWPPPSTGARSKPRPAKAITHGNVGAGRVLSSAAGKTGTDLFLGLGVSQPLVNSLRQRPEFAHIKKPTSFQKTVMSAVATGLDVIAQQATGQGKTFSILMALLSIPPPRESIKVNYRVQAEAVMFVSSEALARQILKWAALLLPPTLVDRTIGFYDPATAEAPPKEWKPPRIVVTTREALEPTHVTRLRGLATSTIVLDEADSLIWSARSVNKPAVAALEKMLQTGTLHSTARRIERRKPQVLVVGSTVSPKLVRFFRAPERQYVSSNAKMVLQRPLQTATAYKPVVIDADAYVDESVYVNRAIAALPHHVVLVSPSGRMRNASAPELPAAELEEPLEADPSRLPDHLFNAFLKLHAADVAANPSGTTLFVLQEQDVVKAVAERLQEEGIAVSIDTADSRPSSSSSTTSSSSTAAPTSPVDPSETAVAEDATVTANTTTETEQPRVPAVILTDMLSCRGLDLPSLTAVYTTASALKAAGDYVHVAGRLARLGSATGEGSAHGKVVTLVTGGVHETAEDKADRLERMAAFIKKVSRSKSKGKSKTGPPVLSQADEARLAEAPEFKPANHELEKVKFALETLDAEAVDLQIP